MPRGRPLDEPLRDLSSDDLPEDGPKVKRFPDVIVVFRGRDGRFGWYRRDQNTGEAPYGSLEMYDSRTEAVERARTYHPDLTIDESELGEVG
jgi:hypothetical protein